MLEVQTVRELVGLFDLSTPEPGRLFRLFDGELPLRHKARKAAKADCEALLVLPAFGDYPCGALMAIGSGSRPSRQRAALVAFGAAGELQGPVRAVDLAPLLEPLHDLIPDLNSRAHLSKARHCACSNAATAVRRQTLASN